MNGHDLLPLMKRVAADFVLLDVQLPGLDGLGCLEALAEHHPQVKVAMLTAIEDPQVIEAAFRRGARGYILKSINPFDLPGAIRQIVEETVIHFSTVAHTGASLAKRPGGLSEKELAVLVELCNGHTNKKIARQPLAERADRQVSSAQHLSQARDPQSDRSAAIRARARSFDTGSVTARERQWARPWRTSPSSRSSRSHSPAASSRADVAVFAAASRQGGSAFTTETIRCSGSRNTTSIGNRMKCVCTDLVPGSSRPVPGCSCATPISPRKREANEVATRQRQTSCPSARVEFHVEGHRTIVAR